MTLFVPTGIFFVFFQFSIYFVVAKIVVILLPPKIDQKRKRLLSSLSPHNFGHPLDRKQFISKPGWPQEEWVIQTIYVPQT